MTLFFLEKFPDGEGRHQLHQQGCAALPDFRDRISLGLFSKREGAEAAARAFFPRLSYCSCCKSQSDSGSPF